MRCQLVSLVATRGGLEVREQLAFVRHRRCDWSADVAALDDVVRIRRAHLVSRTRLRSLGFAASS